MTEHFHAKTSFGDFRVKISNRDFISIGGKNFCVQISYRGDNDTELTSLETSRGGCEIHNKHISGELTTKMTHLGFTILKELYPNVKVVHLIDNSSYKCTMPDDSQRGISLMKSSLLIYGQTYYERKFGAVPKFEHDVKTMEEFRKNWADPEFKPTTFNFNNPDLNSLLTPIYNSTVTWKEFMEALNNKFKRKICMYIYPWFLHALSKIQTREIPSHWTIPIESLAEVQYTRTQTGGRHTRRKGNDIGTLYDSNGLYEIAYR